MAHFPPANRLSLALRRWVPDSLQQSTPCQISPIALPVSRSHCPLVPLPPCVPVYLCTCLLVPVSPVTCHLPLVTCLSPACLPISPNAQYYRDIDKHGCKFFPVLLTPSPKAQYYWDVDKHACKNLPFLLTYPKEEFAMRLVARHQPKEQARAAIPPTFAF